jgi:hypothetical protein
VPSVPAPTHTGIFDSIAHLFHKNHLGITPVLQVPEKIEVPLAPPVSETLANPSVETSATPPTTDERFARLLAEDSVYQSMIRSQDVKNIRLQLSMRYMLLILAIFVVIAWVVNNRVIMF